MRTAKGTLTTIAAGALLTLGALGAGTLVLLCGVAWVTLLVVGRLGVRGQTLAVTRKQSAAELVEDETLHVTIELENRQRVARLVEVEDQIPRPAFVLAGSPRDEVVVPARGHASLAFDVGLPLRGRKDAGPVKIRSFDPYRNFERTEESGAKTLTTVYPRRYPIDEFPASSKLTSWLGGQHLVNSPGYGMDFYSLRDYQHTDRIRDINWKASARLGPRSLVVNQRTRESYTEAWIVLDARRQAGLGLESHSALAQGCRAVLSLIPWLTRRRDAVRIFVLQERLQEIRPGSSDRQVADAIDLFLNLEPRDGPTMEDALLGRLGTLPARAPAIFVSNLEGDATIPAVIGNLRSRAHPVTVLLPQPTFRLDGRAPGAPTPEPYVEETVRHLRGMGAHVVRWDPRRPLLEAVEQEMTP